MILRMGTHAGKQLPIINEKFSGEHQQEQHMF